jgi:hypothetical protein
MVALHDGRTVTVAKIAMMPNNDEHFGSAQWLPEERVTSVRLQPWEQLPNQRMQSSRRLDCCELDDQSRRPIDPER